VALAVVAGLLVMYGPYLVWPLLVTGAALLYLRLRRRSAGGPAQPAAVYQRPRPPTSP
jgi:amino acid efflux transporter